MSQDRRRARRATLERESRSQALGRTAPATGRRHPADCRTTHPYRSGTEDRAAVYEPVGCGGAGGSCREGLSRRRTAERTHAARHPEPHELPAETNSKGQAAEEDGTHRRDLRERESRAGVRRRRCANPGNLRGYQGQSQTGSILAGGKKPGPTATARSSRRGIMIRRRKTNWSRSVCWNWPLVC